jgi:rhamnose utilization protein RhaD (predicted bifunctional aldolase and dehydrogenase)
MDHTLQQLIDMSNYLGDPAKDFAMLGEGNTSARIDAESLYVKASGTTLNGIGAEGFVRVSIPKVLSILDDEKAGDDEVTKVLQEAILDPGEKRRPSVETMLHAILLQFPEYAFVGHAHPVYTNMILCSQIAEEASAGRLFPDQIVSMGHRAVFVPYVDPGLTLAREVKKLLKQFIEEEGMLPKAILMQNHGLITMGDSPKAVLSCMEMTEKSMRVLQGTYALGGPYFLPKDQVERIYSRPDEKYRMQSIAGTQ